MSKKYIKNHSDNVYKNKTRNILIRSSQPEYHRIINSIMDEDHTRGTGLYINILIQTALDKILGWKSRTEMPG